MSSSKSWQISRRHLLRGVGTTMALPFLEAMIPVERAMAQSSTVMPIRFAGFFMPNGVNHGAFDPKGSTLSKLPPTLMPLEELREHLTVITGINNADNGHAAGTSAFLTGGKPKRTGKAAEVQVSNPSLDQIIGNAAKEGSVLPTLELGLHTPRSGVSMSGHSQVYTSFVSWKTRNTPVPHEINPQRAFDRLFKGARVTSGGPGGAQSFRPDPSVLDAVLDDAKDLQKRLGYSDKQKLDEYLTAVRDVEERLEHQSKAAEGLKITRQVMDQIRATGNRIDKLMDGKGGGGSYRAAPNIPYREHGQLMMDVMALSFWSNSTRASTLMFGDGLNGRNMSFLKGIDGNHHSISHHGNKPENLRKFAIINTFFMEQYGYFLNKLKGMSEAGSNVLENSICLLGSNISSGQVHNGKNIPIVVGGNARGQLRGNQHIAAGGQPIAQVHRSILDMMNLDGDQIQGGDKKLRGFG